MESLQNITYCYYHCHQDQSVYPHGSPTSPNVWPDYHWSRPLKSVQSCLIYTDSPVKLPSGALRGPVLIYHTRRFSHNENWTLIRISEFGIIMPFTSATSGSSWVSSGQLTSSTIFYRSPGCSGLPKPRPEACSPAKELQSTIKSKIMLDSSSSVYTPRSWRTSGVLSGR